MSAAPAKVEYPRIDNIPQTPAFDDTDFKMTCIVSGSGDMNVQWLKDEVSVDTTDFAVTTIQVKDGQYMYGQTDAKNTTLVWQVSKKTRYLTCNTITHFNGNYTCAVTTETAGAMTRDVSKAFIVNVQYEAHWSSGPTLTAAAPNETSKEIVCSVCANPQPNFQWTFNNETLRDGINVMGDRIILDVVKIEDFGSYMCSVNNEVNGEERSELFQIDLVERGPARAPLKFTILSNHTSVTLTLQWHPGFDGGYPPQTFTLQYRASNEVALRTWSDIFIYTTDETTWHQATVTGLQPQTQYVFSLFAENSRPRNKGPNRSLTVTQTGSTTVVIYYQPDNGEEARYPLEGSVAAEERQVTINGQFDDKAKYKVWLKVYEGLLDVSSQQTKPFEAAVEKTKVSDLRPTTSPGSIVVIGASVAAVVVVLIIISVIVILLYRRRAKNKDCGDAEAKPDGMLMVCKENEMVDGYSNVACDNDQQSDDNGVTYAQMNKKKKGEDNEAKKTDDDDAVIYTNVVGTKAAIPPYLSSRSPPISVSVFLFSF
ncbi:hypothetical protein LSAT2_014517 [Lamellibrachia satsuma]|nr:hypothetical protein LSAT2_014517 [Lamellibrachia satsuma]